MGLDMFLLKAECVPGFTLEDYLEADKVIANAYWGQEYENSRPKTEAELREILKREIDKDFAQKITLYEKEFGSTKIFTPFLEVAYWRKANQIHGWFVENVQHGEDNCDFYEVRKEHLSELLDRVNAVLKNKSLAPKLLPTYPGFFFGPTEYEEHYSYWLEESKKMLSKVIRETDWNREMVVYASSW